MILGEEKIPTLSRILRIFEERGLKKDLEQGLQLRKEQIAINMFKRDFDLQTISKILDVDIRIIKSWLKKENLL